MGIPRGKLPRPKVFVVIIIIGAGLLLFLQVVINLYNHGRPFYGDSDGDALILLWVSLALLHGVICASLCSRLATEKGHKTGEWAFNGFILGIFALIAAAGLPDRKYQHGHLPESDQPPTD